MKLKSMKKVLAAVLSTTMVMGMSMTVLATDPGNIGTASPTNPMGANGAIQAPIYSFDVIDVVVPTSYAVAFNPDGLVVKMNTATTPTTSNAPVLSKNYGIVNKSSKNKIIKVELTVGCADTKVNFVTTSASATSPSKNSDYNIYLTAVPASDAITIGRAPATPTAPTTSTTPEQLADVNMSAATSASATVPLSKGKNEIAFGLEKATYASDGNLVVGQGNNDVTRNYTVDALAAGNKGATGFTFSGAINPKADWTKITEKVTITPLYSNETAEEDTFTPVAGSFALYQDPKPKFTTGGVGEILYTAGEGNDAFKGLVKVTAPWDNKPFDITSSSVAANGKITVQKSILAGWAGKKENPTATITYKNQADVEVTATVILKTY